jgi:hypothetical protein
LRAQAELAKVWSAAAIWKVLNKNKELSCSYKTFVAHVRRLQLQAATTQAGTKRICSAYGLTTVFVTYFK